jgi:hypothetical protein
MMYIPLVWDRPKRAEELGEPNDDRQRDLYHVHQRIDGP